MRAPRDLELSLPWKMYLSLSLALCSPILKLCFENNQMSGHAAPFLWGCIYIPSILLGFFNYMQSE